VLNPGLAGWVLFNGTQVSDRNKAMNENEVIATNLHDQLEKGFPVVLISILSLQGSTPRHDGAKMLVGLNGQTWGTIGGSLIEATAIREAWEVLSSGRSRLLNFELNGQNASAPDMICGGKARILLDCLISNLENKDFAAAWLAAIRQGDDFFLLTQIKEKGMGLDIIGHAVLYRDARRYGNCVLDPADIENIRTELHNISATEVLNVRDTQVIVDSLRKVKTLYCCGAGHVAVPTARIAALVGFRVVVLDDRPEYANPERFPEAHKTIVVDDFNRALAGLEIDEDSFIVIVTHGHQYDREVLEQSLKTSACYIGMISSRRKKAAIFEALLSRGFKPTDLDKVHSPIGLEIGGETPEEIAVSIVAELIKERNKKL
jgi:xanthine dehydrogenase accessory factor